jgi:hypothetical protein
MDRFSPRPFVAAARAAFPVANRDMADEAIRHLTPWVDDTYRQRSIGFDVLGQSVQLPTRLHFQNLPSGDGWLSSLPPSALCLVSRATDGFLRQRAASAIVNIKSEWAPPFVAALLGDYVVEIADVICDAIPGFDQALYADFVRENRTAVRTLRAQATSYWAAYYRDRCPEKRDYPALRALHEMETWAA